MTEISHGLEEAGIERVLLCSRSEWASFGKPSCPLSCSSLLGNKQIRRPEAISSSRTIADNGIQTWVENKGTLSWAAYMMSERRWQRPFSFLTHQTILSPILYPLEHTKMATTAAATSWPSPHTQQIAYNATAIERRRPSRDDAMDYHPSSPLPSTPRTAVPSPSSRRRPSTTKSTTNATTARPSPPAASRIVQLCGDFRFAVGSSYRICDIIGEGAYGVVCSAIHKASGMKVAIKKIQPFEHQ